MNVQMEGSEGMALMGKLMKAFRESPPHELGGDAVIDSLDRLIPALESL